MSTATVTTKGQIRIPVDMRRELKGLKGRFGKPRRAVTIDEMNAATAAPGSRAR